MFVWILGGVLAAVAVVLLAGLFRWRHASEELARRVGRRASETAKASAARGALSPAELADLPEPVARYFRHVLPMGQPLIRTAELRQEGEFRIRPDDDGWRPFRAVHVASARPPGFMWDARIFVAPFVAVHVRDAYVAGAGSMHGELLAVYPLVDDRGKPELDSGALQRYLAEAVWLPTALLPSHGVHWEGIDEHTARATLTDAGTTVSLEFRFNDTGAIIGSFASGRFREVDGDYVPTPWGGRYWRYEERQGMRIPLEVEVEWYLPGGASPYWRGRIVQTRYDSG